MKIAVASLFPFLSTAMTVQRVAVIGGTGRLGRLAVQQLVEQGKKVKLLSRKPPLQSDDALNQLEAVSVVSGSVQDAKSLETLVEDCQACLALFGSTRNSKLSDLFAKNIQSHRGRRKKGCKRIVRITGKGEDPTGFFTVLMNLLGSMAKAWNYKGELALRGQSYIEYTIICPGVINFEGP